MLIQGKALNYCPALVEAWDFEEAVLFPKGEHGI